MASIHIASDHAGFALKASLILNLTSLGHNVVDHGTNSSASCDYPLYARKVCTSVLQDDSIGILICGTGIGMSIVANRMEGIRAALCGTEFQARACRLHNNANVLCLGERITGTGLAYAIAHAFLETDFEGGRHQRRIDLIDHENDNDCQS